LDQNTLNHYDEHSSNSGLKKALNAALPQAIYQDEFQAYISGIKEKNSSAEDINQAAQLWLKEKTGKWLDWKSIEANDGLLNWMQQVMEDKPLAMFNHYADDDLVWVAGKTKEWRALIKRYASLYSDRVARWNGRKLAWTISFKA